MVTTVNFIYFKVAEGVDLTCSHHNTAFNVVSNNKMAILGGDDVLTNPIVAITSQYIHVSNCHAVHLKLTQQYMSIISQQS